MASVVYGSSLFAIKPILVNYLISTIIILLIAATQASQSGTLTGSNIYECVSQKCLASQVAKIGCGVASGSYVAQLDLSNAAAKYNKHSPNAAATVCGGFVGAVMGN